MARIAVGGDPCGGLIIATASSTIDGAGIARIGDMITPHGNPPNVHVGARIVSGSFRLRLGGSRPSRNNDYATCGHVISASNTTDDSSRHWAPVPPVAAIAAIIPMDRALEVDWTQAEHYPGHSGAIVQWHGPGGNFDAPPEQGVSFAADAQGATITGLTNGVLYTVRVISTRRFAHEDALPSAEATGRPALPPPMPP